MKASYYLSYYPTGNTDNPGLTLRLFAEGNLPLSLFRCAETVIVRICRSWSWGKYGFFLSSGSISVGFEGFLWPRVGNAALNCSMSHRYSHCLCKWIPCLSRNQDRYLTIPKSLTERCHSKNLFLFVGQFAESVLRENSNTLYDSVGQFLLLLNFQ